MTYKTFKSLVQKHGGWIEDGVAYFPTVHARRQFEHEIAGHDPR